MKLKALAIAPYEAMRTVLQEIQDKRPDLDMDIFLGTYKDYVKKIPEIDFYRYDCILARGHTVAMIKDNSSIPVFEIKISFYDMLRVITMAKRRNVPFAIIGSANILTIAHQVIDILQYKDIYTCPIESEEDADACIQQITKEGVRLIVGDVYAVNAAQRKNVSALLITSSKISLEEAIKDATSVRKQYLRLSQRLSLISEVIKGDVSSVIVYDSQHKIVLSNFTDLQCPPQKLERLLLTHMAKLCEKNPSVSGIHRIEGTILNIRGKYLVLEESYFAFFISATPAPPVTGKRHIQALYPSEEVWQDIHSRAFQLPQELLGSPEASLSNRFPTVIIGDTGTSKELLAQYLWCTGNFASFPLITLDCTAVTQSPLEQFFSNPNSPVYEQHVPLLITNLQALTEDCQQSLCRFLEDTSFSTHHPFVVTTTQVPSALVSQGKLMFQLCDYLVGNHLYVKNLRQRAEDIPVIVDILINKYNLELGKEVIALTPDALSVLQRFHWPYNINQLKSVIRQLIASINQHYISQEHVEAVLNSYEASIDCTHRMDLSGPLHEIEHRIIACVLQEEHMNYSMAAKRLGISRSTLYRKLKSAPEYTYAE